MDGAAGLFLSWKRIDESDPIDDTRRAHILRVKSVDVGIKTGAQEQAVPVRKAVATGQEQGVLHNAKRGRALERFTGSCRSIE